MSDKNDDYDTDSDVGYESDSRELVRPPFTDNFTRLPATGAVDQAHVIETSELDESKYEDCFEEYDFRIQDVTCTLLFKISPDTLEKFLSSSTKNFKLIQWKPESPWVSQLVIWRKGQEVLVGDYWNKDLNGDAIFEWDNLVRCQIDLDGSWKVTYATFGQYNAARWGDVWDKKVVTSSLGGFNQMVKSTDEKQRMAHVRTPGCSVLFSNRWDPEKSQWKIKTD